MVRIALRGKTKMQDHRVFVLRMHDEGPPGEPLWRGIIELVGTDEQRAIGAIADVVAFVELWLAKVR
jgi:hypothetical protein